MSETANASPYMTTEELAVLTRSTVYAVRQMRHRGLGPRGTKVGRRVLYARQDVDAWLRAKAEADHIGQRTADRNSA